MELPASSIPKPNGGINTLPNELLGRILSFSGSRDLLRFRGVNYLWNLIGSSICRHRHVRVSYFAPPTFLDEILPRVTRQTFTDHMPEIEYRQSDDFPNFDLDNLPFSAYIPLDPEYMSNATENFLAIYGPQLWKFELDENYFDDMVSLLQFTPNIHQLRILENGSGRTLKNKGDLPPQLRLLHLTYLEMSHYDVLQPSNLDLLHFILVECHAPVKTIKFSLIDASEDTITSVINLIQNMESIHISIHIDSVTPNVLKLLDQKALQIRGLGIDLLRCWRFTGSLVDYYVPAKRLVDKYSSILESLYLRYYIDDTTVIPNVSFKFPILPRLTRLRVDYFVEGDPDLPGNYEMDHTRILLAQLTPQHVPILNQVELDARICEYRDEKYNRSQTFFSPFHSFPSVKALDISFGVTDGHSCLTPAQDWNRLFPNLEKITQNVCDSNVDTIQNLLRNYQHLEHLCLHLGFSGDINVLLSGIPNPDRIYTKSKDEVAEERARHNFPSLLEFKRLKTLEVRHVDPIFAGSSTFPGSIPFPGRIRDSGVSLCLLEIQPLENLTIIGHHISPEWEAKLRRHHHHVVLRRLCADFSSGDDKEDHNNSMEDEENGTNEMVG